MKVPSPARALPRPFRIPNVNSPAMPVAKSLFCFYLFVESLDKQLKEEEEN